jgi:HEAT repeat protein
MKQLIAGVVLILSAGMSASEPKRFYVDDESLDVCVAARALYAHPRPAVDARELVEALKHDTKARVAAAWELSRIGPFAEKEVTAPLIAALAHPDKHERNFVVLALAMSGEQIPDVARALEQIANDPGSQDSPQTDYKYARALAAVALDLSGDRDGPAPRDDVSALVRKLSTGSSRINPRVVSGLRALGEFAGTTKPAATKATRRALPVVHESISLAIGYIDSLANPPTPHQIAREDQSRKLSDESRQYVMALGGVQPRIAAVLRQTLADSRQNDRVLAIRQLAAMGPSAKEALPALQSALVDPDWIIRREAFVALRQVANSD